MIRNITQYSQRLAAGLLLAAMAVIAVQAQTKDLRKAIPDQPAERVAEAGQIEIAGQDDNSNLVRRRRADAKPKPETDKVPVKRTHTEKPLIKQDDAKAPKAIVEEQAGDKERGDLGRPGGVTDVLKKTMPETRELTGGPTQEFVKVPTRPRLDSLRKEASPDAKKQEEKFKATPGGKRKADLRACSGCRNR